MTWPKVSFSADTSQLLYALFVVVLVPLILIFNSLYLLRIFRQNSDLEINNKTLLMSSILSLEVHGKLSTPQELNNDIKLVIKDWPEIKAVEVYKESKGALASVTSTSNFPKTLEDPILNELAWGADRPYSKQITNNLGSGLRERIWIVSSPIHNDTGQKIGLINLYFSAAKTDALNREATRNSLLLLLVTVGVVILILLNHFRFFEISILFSKLNELDKIKDDFISMASHELRVPLTAISSYSYLLLKNPNIRKDEKLKKQVGVIFASTERLKTLVDEILDVSRIEQKRMNFNIIHNDLGGIIESVINEFAPIAQSKGLKLSYIRPVYPIVVSCDRDKMHQVFANLISNGLKYTLEGEVTVYHEVKNGTVRTFVKDTGVGIPKESLQQLFTKFYRVYNPQTQDVFGTGLGLWITKQLVDKMGGTISVESAENQGSQFIVEFPIHYPAREKDKPKPQSI